MIGPEDPPSANAHYDYSDSQIRWRHVVSVNEIIEIESLVLAMASHQATLSGNTSLVATFSSFSCNYYISVTVGHCNSDIVRDTCINIVRYTCVNVVGKREVVNADKTGTKCAAVLCFTLQPHCHAVVRCRLYHVTTVPDAAFGVEFDSIFSLRQRECHEFYSQVSHSFATELA